MWKKRLVRLDRITKGKVRDSRRSEWKSVDSIELWYYWVLPSFIKEKRMSYTKKGLATWVYRFVWRYTKSLKASPGCQENNKTRLHCNLYCHKLSFRDLRYPNCKYSRNSCQKTRDRKTCSCSLDMLCNQSHGRLQYNNQQPWVLSSRYRSKIVSKPANNWPHAVITSLMWSVESPSSQFWLLFMRCCSSCVITSHCGWHKDQSPAVGLWRE